MRKLIDTTPPVAKPPQNLVEAAAREIPPIFADHRPQPDGRVQMFGSRLVTMLQGHGHTLAAGQWAIHEAVQNGRLEASYFEVDPPTYGRSVGGTMRHMGGADDRRVEFTPVERKRSKLPANKPVPFNRFKVTPTELLWEWWHSWEGVEPALDMTVAKESEPIVDPPLPVPAKPKTPKRSTEKGEGEAKLIAALTKYHQYAEGSCLNAEPIGNNALARLAGVSESTASAFFNKEFNGGQGGGHAKYRAICGDVSQIVTALKLLNREFSPHLLYGSKPPDEDEREE